MNKPLLNSDYSHPRSMYQGLPLFGIRVLMKSYIILTIFICSE
jgi:hypothetical protein